MINISSDVKTTDLILTNINFYFLFNESVTISTISCSSYECVEFLIIPYVSVLYVISEFLARYL